MVSEVFDSFKENLRQKTTNPFLGTLALVWTVHNWRLLLSLFNINDWKTIPEKIAALEVYLKTTVFLWNLVDCLWITLLVLVATYALLNLSRMVVNFFDRSITPYVLRISDKGSVVSKEEFKELQQAYNKLEIRLDEERAKRLELQGEFDRLEDRSANKPTPSPIGPQSVDVDILLKQVRTSLTTEAFDRVMDAVLNKIQMVNTTEGLSYLLKRGIVRVEKKDANSAAWGTYILTDLGEKLRTAYYRELQ